MNTTMHLTEDQIDDVLMGDLAATTAAHLAACEDCKLRVAEFATPIASFKAVSLAWSERQSATLPSKLTLPVTSAWQRGASWAAATAVLLVGIGVPMARHETRATQIVASNGTSQAAPRTAIATVARVQEAGRGAPGLVAPTKPDAQIARDNQMLQAIDRELDASVQSPADTFGLAPAGGPSAGHGHFAPVQIWD